jgi:hypothetical protein
MILLIAASEDSEAAEIVEAALHRSFSARQVLRCEKEGLAPAKDGVCAVVLNPDNSVAKWIAEALAKRAKILMLGQLGADSARLLGVDADGDLPAASDWLSCEPAPGHQSRQSPGRIDYEATGLAAGSPIRRRYLQRFDFTDEWNNLGYGRIALDGGIWSIAQAVRPDGATVVAELGRPDDLRRFVYSAMRDEARASLLWFNRQVGPVDSQEWRLIEVFFSDYRADALPCRPHLREVPLGWEAAVTMRVDCDEDISSARPLFDLYRSLGLPFSVAVMTGLPASEANIGLLRKIAAADGSILSHSQSHLPHWGGSESAAFEQAARSKAWLERHLPGCTVRHAVSPFHQTPAFALPALLRAGYTAVVGGSIAAEPQHLLGRGGRLPAFDRPFVSHSQQCMLHGDCLLAAGDPLRVYKDAFRLARSAHSIFAYLDHAFSDRYNYGWTNESERSLAHRDLLGFFRSEIGTGAWQGRLLFMSEGECLDFITLKSESSIAWAADGQQFTVEGPPGGRLALAVRYKGRWWPTDRPVAA